MLRIGHSFDLHRLKSGKRLVLGGIEIPCAYESVGVSDGDVLLHAFSEALLGALALGDIGEHFPPKDPESKNLDSKTILMYAYDKVKQAGYQLVNADCMIFLEEPNLKTYKKPIQNRIADLLKVASDQISIKATTHEGLGPIGTKAAIAASCDVLLESKPQIRKL